MHKLSTTIRLSLCILVLSTLCCGDIDPEDSNADSPDFETPPPLEDWLVFTDVSPDDEISVQPTIAIDFNQYLDTTTFNSFGTVRLASGGLTRGGRVDYRMTRKRLLFRPYNALEPRLDYSLRWLAEDVESVVGSPLIPGSALPDFRTRRDLEPTEPIRRPRVEWQEVEELFEQHCNDCHTDPDWSLPELTRDGLVGRRSEQTDTMLVEPYHPARSYLMHKILPDYPIRRHTVQPPPWTGRELTRDEIERIEHWIARGAPD